MVYPFFGDIHKFVAVHPVIYHAEQIGENEYKLSEKMNIAGLKIAFSYPVKLEKLLEHKQVVMFAVIRKSATLRLTFDFKETGGITVLHEHISFEGPRIVSGTFLKFLTKVHLKLIAEINLKLSGTT
jgi:carbon monoxide dehydrogenase subunit G